MRVGQLDYLPSLKKKIDSSTLPLGRHLALMCYYYIINIIWDYSTLSFTFGDRVANMPQAALASSPRCTRILAQTPCRRSSSCEGRQVRRVYECLFRPIVSGMLLKMQLLEAYLTRAARVFEWAALG